mgnify:FL=1
MLKHLNEKNSVTIYSVTDPCFETYGRVISNINCNELISFMEQNTVIPEKGNIYVASVEELERTHIAEFFKNRIYGEMPIQIGYCNGRNTTYNGFEYHKGSEINIAVTDFMLVLGHTWEIKDNTYRIEDAKVFFVEKGTAREIFKDPRHPYTIGLMNSKPVVGKHIDKLYSIPGSVPNPVDMPNYCYFKDRCEMCVEECEGAYPAAYHVSPTHVVSCYRCKEGGTQNE